MSRENVQSVLAGYEAYEHSGVETEMREAHVYKIRERKAVAAWQYRTKEEALEAVGLRE